MTEVMNGFERVQEIDISACKRIDLTVAGAYRIVGYSWSNKEIFITGSHIYLDLNYRTIYCNTPNPLIIDGSQITLCNGTIRCNWKFTEQPLEHELAVILCKRFVTCTIQNVRIFVSFYEWPAVDLWAGVLVSHQKDGDCHGSLLKNVLALLWKVDWPHEPYKGVPCLT